jgi:hypothetical protein
MCTHWERPLRRAASVTGFEAVAHDAVDAVHIGVRERINHHVGDSASHRFTPSVRLV